MFLLLFYPSHRLGKHWSVSFEQMEVIPLPDDIILDERTTTKPSLCGFPKDASYVLFFELTGENSFKKKMNGQWPFELEITTYFAWESII